MMAMASIEAALLRRLAGDLHRLRQAAPAGSTVYALAEAALCTPEGALARWIACHGLEACALLDGTPEARFASDGPWLVALPARMPDIAIDELARLAALPQALLLLGSPLPMLRLANHLRSWLDAAMIDAEGGRTDLLLRCFDACTGMAMVDLWPAVERQAFLGAFDGWWGWNARFGLEHRAGAARPMAAPRTEALVLGEALLERIDALNRAERLLHLVLDEDVAAGELDGVPCWLHRAIARRALAHAHALGLTGWHNERIAVALCLRVHPAILEQPWMRALAATARTQNGGLLRAVAGIAPEVLEDERRRHAARVLEDMAREIAGRASSHQPAASPH